MWGMSLGIEVSRPYGTWPLQRRFPTLKRLAIFMRPSGTTLSRRVMLRLPCCYLGAEMGVLGERMTHLRLTSACTELRRDGSRGKGMILLRSGHGGRQPES